MKVFYVLLILAEGIVGTLLVQKIMAGDGTWFTGGVLALGVLITLNAMYKVVSSPERRNAGIDS